MIQCFDCLDFALAHEIYIPGELHLLPLGCMSDCYGRAQWVHSFSLETSGSSQKRYEYLQNISVLFYSHLFNNILIPVLSSASSPPIYPGTPSGASSFSNLQSNYQTPCQAIAIGIAISPTPLAILVQVTFLACILLVPVTLKVWILLVEESVSICQQTLEFMKCHPQIMLRCMQNRLQALNVIVKHRSWAHNHAAPRYVPKSSTIGPEDSATAKFYSSSRHRPGRDVKHHSCGISYIGDLLGGMNLEGSQSNRDRGHTLKQGHISGRSRPDGGARSHPGIHVFAGSTRGNTIYEETAFGAPGPSTTSSQLARRTTANTISTARPRGPSTLGGINCSGNSVMGHSHAASIQCRGHISGSVSGNRGETSQIINIIIKNEPASPAPTPAPVPPSVIPVVYPYCYNTASSPYWYWN